MSSVGSSPALATCETSQVLLAGVSSGSPVFAPTYWLARLVWAEIILKGAVNWIKKKSKHRQSYQTFCRGTKAIHVNNLFVVPHFLNLTRKTCPWKVYPLIPNFYIAKLGFTGIYLFFLFLFQNLDCGYSLTCTSTLTQCFEQTYQNNQNVCNKIFNY